MQKVGNPVANLRIAAPCPASWEGMAGDERVRHCTLCDLKVYNFAEMTSAEVRQVLARSEGRVCGRLYQRADGTLLTRDCPTGLRALQRRASRAAAAVISALLALPSLFCGTTRKTPPTQARGGTLVLDVMPASSAQQAMFEGAVRDRDGFVIPGARIVVRDEASKREAETITDADGAFSIPSLCDGVYRVEVGVEGLDSASFAQVRLQADQATHASVVLRPDELLTTTVGVMTNVSSQQLPLDVTVSTTFSQYFINTLPR
jgi:hypothetical protein